MIGASYTNAGLLGHDWIVTCNGWKRVFLAFWPKCMHVFQDVFPTVLGFRFHPREDVLKAHFPMAPGSILWPLNMSDSILGISFAEHKTGYFSRALWSHNCKKKSLV